ncbi:hypothetical protein ACVOMV_26105 (plasmid) [Mesorhizobium atlanticum]
MSEQVAAEAEDPRGNNEPCARMAALTRPSQIVAVIICAIEMTIMATPTKRKFHRALVLTFSHDGGAIDRCTRTQGEIRVQRAIIALRKPFRGRIRFSTSISHMENIETFTIRPRLLGFVFDRDQIGSCLDALELSAPFDRAV